MIAIKKSHRGLLHKNLGVPQIARIPVGRIKAALNSKSAAIRKRAQFALNARSWGKS